MKIMTLCIPIKKDTVAIQQLLESFTIQSEFIQVLVIAKKPSQMLINQINQAKEILDVEITDGSNLYQQINGLYFKIIEPDSIVHQSSLVSLIKTIKDLVGVQTSLDMIVCDYEFQTNKKKRSIVSYQKHFLFDSVHSWHQLKKNNLMPTLTNSAITIKSNFIREMEFNIQSVLCETTYALLVIEKVKTMYYTHEIFEAIVKLPKKIHIDELIPQLKCCIDVIDLESIKSRKQRHYICQHFNYILAGAVYELLNQDSIDGILLKEEILHYMKVNNYILYRSCIKSPVGKALYSDNLKITKTIAKLYK